MLKLVNLVFISFLSIVSLAQDFEGVIVYKNSYKSKMAAVSDEQFNAMMGGTQEFFIKEGDYKSTGNGSMFQWQLYINKENKLYTKMANNETLIWNDGAVNPDSVLKADLKKDVMEVLGYMCDELVLTCKSGVQKYYFSSKIPLDAKLYVNHKFGNWYDFIAKANALPLKSVIENAQFSLESVATEIKPIKLEKSFFELPANVKTMKSPY